MQLKDHIFSIEEEKTINKILSTFSSEFPEVRLQYRDDIIGIGESGKFLMCYLSLSDGFLYIKFKPYKNKVLFTAMEYDEEIAQTIKYFKNNDVSLSSSKLGRKRDDLLPSTKNEGERNQDIATATLAIPPFFTYEIFCEDYEKIINDIKPEYMSLTFERCSSRLFNALYRNKIFTVADLKNYDILQINKFNNLGKKSIVELGIFLVELTEGKGRRILEERQKAQSRLIILNPLNFDNSVEKYINNIEECSELYIEILEYTITRANKLLSPREFSVFTKRICGEPYKTLEDIGQIYGVSRERIRQIYNKAVNRFSSSRYNFSRHANLTEKLGLIIEKIKKISIEAFIAYVCIEKQNLLILDVVFGKLLNVDLKEYRLKNTLNGQLKNLRLSEKREQDRHLFNDRVLNLIKFSERKKISEQEFFSLDVERFPEIVDLYNIEVKHFEYEGKIYSYFSEAERRLVEKLLINKTFKAVKTHSLRVDVDGKYCFSDIQCLTYDNYLVLIEYTELLHMAKYKNIVKYKKLQKYCDNYGFGLLITDDRLNSFYHIDQPNEPLEKELLENLFTEKSIDFQTYSDIYKKHNGTGKSFVTMVKKHGLYFDIPFCLKKM